MDLTQEHFDALSARLAEAEETLRAIRHNEIDALVVSTAEGARIFTLESAEKPYRMFVENMAEGAVTLAPDGAILYSNHRFSEMVGVAPERLLTTPLRNYIEESDRAAFDALGVAARLASVHAEVTLKSANQACIPVLLTTSLLPMPGSGNLCLVVSNLSERKRAELALYESEERFHKAIEVMQEGFVLYSQAGEIVGFNRSTERLLDLSVDQIMGHRSGSLTRGLVQEDGSDFPVETLPITLSLQQGFAQNDVVVGIDRLSGERIWTSVNSAPLFQDGKITGAVVTFTDITERTKAKMALVESRQRLQSLFDNAPVGILVAANDGKYLETNRAVCRMLGYTHEELLGRSIFDLLSADTPEAMVADLRKRFVDGGDAQSIFWLSRKDGSELAIEYSAVADISPGTHLSIFTDVTEREQAKEKLLRANEELVRSNADLQQFAYVASHDLQEPLRMVASFMQLLQKTYQGQLDEQADRWITYAVDGATRMKTLISDLLSYSRVGTHGNPLQRSDMNHVLSLALKNLALAISENSADITFEVLPMIQGDAVQLVSLFQNLIGNAIKYRGKASPHIHISVRREGQDWLFCVRDNGIGIAPEFSERIFIIFQRLHIRSKYSGTGIGLALCKRIVEQHGGHIWVVSEPGEGAAFFFKLPVKQKELDRDRTVSE